MKGLLVSIFRSEPKGGQSLNRFNDCDRLVLVHEKMDTIFSANESSPAVTVLEKEAFGRKYQYAVPLTEKGEPLLGGMFGGNFISTCDSRFRRAFGYPVPLHDRFE